MSNPTTPFSWQMPTATDLVTDLPADFEVFGQAVATSMADLLGGTSGQILAKNSNTDMDFVWVTNDVGDITAVTAGTGISGGGTSGTVTITNSMATEITAKGDLIVGTGSATFDNLAAGANGETLVADSSTSTGLRYQGNFAAGKNKVINGDFLINQRAFSSTTTSATYMFDRWSNYLSDGTVTYSSQSFALGTAPVAGYEGTTFLRCVTSGQTATGAAALLFQKIESVRTFANQTVTVSFWAKAGTGTPKVALELGQNFGSGGSASVNNYLGQVTLSTSWVRYSATFAIPSIAGKTIGTGDNLGVNFWTSAGSDFNSRTGSLGIQSATIDFWGVQVEAGSVATAFQTATGTIQGELAACQRYYSKTYNQSEAPGYSPATSAFNAINASTTLVVGVPVFKASMRTSPSITLFSAATGTSGKIRSGGADVTATAADVGENGIGYLSATGLVAGSNSTICYVASAEL